MISGIRLKNFKCFSEVNLDLSKITLLTGPNSSGKSSIIYSLLGAFQSSNFPFQYDLNGSYVKMGDYREVVHSHVQTKDITIEFSFMDEGSSVSIKSIWEEDSTKRLTRLKYLSIEEPGVTLKIEKKKVYHFSLEINREEFDLKKVKAFGSNSISDLILTSANMAIEEDVQQKDFQKIIRRDKSKIYFTFKDFEKIDNKLLLNGGLRLYLAYRSLLLTFQETGEKLNFVSSFRLYPERTYYQNVKNDLKVGRFGENYIDQILQWELHNKEKYTTLLKKLREIGLVNNIRANKLSGGRFEMVVQSKEKGISATLNDVGFGVSQFLPIVTADLQLGPNSTLCIAQPEIHLHPSIQAKFGDYLLKQVLVHDKRYIIETHSEYLLNRLRLLIAKEELEEKDISIYYFENDGNNTKTYPIQFLKNGQIKNAPKSFFKTYMMDVMNIALEATE